MKLGMVTYNLGKDWDIPAIIENCTEAGFEGVELRTTHPHGVEVDLSKSERDSVCKQFADSVVEIAGLGSAFDYHSLDADEVKASIEGTKEYTKLAADVGSPGVKVRPNGVHTDEGVPIEQTLDQIGAALGEVAAFAADLGVEIRLEVHGAVTCQPPNIKHIMDAANHPNALVCWNSNMDDVGPDGSIAENFALLKDKIALVHITELTNEYPWHEEMQLLKSIDYKGFTLAEIPESVESVRLMKYYRRLWEELQRD
jgi:sugar phosphate isomerase/epimerase